MTLLTRYSPKSNAKSRSDQQGRSRDPRSASDPVAQQPDGQCRSKMLPSHPRHVQDSPAQIAHNGGGMALAPAVCCPCCRQRTRPPFPAGVKEPEQFGSPPGGLGQGDRSIASKLGVRSGTDTSLQREMPDSACGEPLMDGRMPLGLIEPLPPGIRGSIEPNGTTRRTFPCCRRRGHPRCRQFRGHCVLLPVPRGMAVHLSGLPHGIPSHDTPGRAGARPDASRFEEDFRNRMQDALR